MLPGKVYTPDDILRIFRRRFWLALVPLAVASAATALYVRTLPNFYRSETTILVVPQRVPESYVRPIVTERVEDRLQSIRPTILSRTRLELIIQEFDLYPEERRTWVMADVVDLMRGAISVNTRGNDSFTVAYVGRDPQKVMEVTNRLARLFVDESLKDRVAHSEDTDQFLESRLEQARQQLVAQEKALAEFKMKYAGELPNQYQANLQQASAARAQVQSVVEHLNTLRERHLFLERQIAEARSAAPGSEAAGGSGGLSPTARDLAAARQQLADLQARFTAQHPDVQRARRSVAELEAKLRAEDAREREALESLPVSPAEAARQNRLADLNEQLRTVDQQIARAEQDEQDLRAAADAAQARVDALPTRESQLTALTRDYGVLERNYNELLAKKQNAEMATDLERRQIGEQFQVLDPASLPERPVSPNRPRMITAAMGGGLVLGLGLIAFLEYRDESFKTDDEIRAVLKLPVLAVVPVMRSDREERRRFRWAVALHAGLGAAVAGCLAIVAYTLLR